MAGLGWKAWTREKLSAAAFQGYVQDQVIMRFASAAARNAALPTPSDGMACYLLDVDRFERRVGGAWLPYLTGRAPVFQAYASGAPQANLALGWSDIRLDSENFDSHNMHGADPFAYVIPETGAYGLEGTVAFEQNPANPHRAARITVNGTVFPNASGGEGMHGTVHCTSSTGRKVWGLTAGAVIRLQGYSNVANWGTRVDVTAGHTSALAIERLIGG